MNRLASRLTLESSVSTGMFTTLAPWVVKAFAAPSACAASTMTR